MTTQRTTRRRKQAVAAAGVVAALLATAACGGGGTDEGGEGGAAGFNAANNKVAQASEAKKGGELKFAAAQDADSWDTTRGYYGFMWNFSRYYARTLVTGKTEPGAKGAEATPDLATSTAKITNDGKTYTYTLRDGVTWEDGKPITTIVFNLPAPNSDFEDMLTMASAAPVRQDKDTKSKYGLKPFSSGPYKFQSYNLDDVLHQRQ